MVRSVFADTSIEKYLDNLIEKDEFSYGIIIGQVKKKSQTHPKTLFQWKRFQATQQGKDSVIHLAKTSEDILNDDTSKDSTQIEVNDVKDIKSEVLVDHALNALRMVPGSFFVLGIFVVSKQSLFDNSEDFKHSKIILQQLAEWVFLVC